MKKFIISILVILCMLFLSYFSNSVINQNNNKDNNKYIIEIKEKMFIQQCIDIYNNPDDYKNKIVKLEGISDIWQDKNSLETCYFVYRKTPGCCGNDYGMMGFLFEYDGKKPKLNDWIAVEGTIKVTNDGNGNENGKVVLVLSKLEIKDKRGNDFVYN